MSAEECCCGACCRTSSVDVLVGGTVWRYRYDQFGWTTRSSQLYESRLLRLGSPLFHFGILVVLVGHVIGLLIPEAGPTRPGCPSRPTTSRRSCSAASPVSAPSPASRS